MSVLVNDSALVNNKVPTHQSAWLKQKNNTDTEVNYIYLVLSTYKNSDTTHL